MKARGINLGHGSASAFAGLAAFHAAAPLLSPPNATIMPDSPMKHVQALTFDVFGTVVDWHGSVVRELKAHVAKSSSPELQSISDQGSSMRCSRKQLIELL